VRYTVRLVQDAAEAIGVPRRVHAGRRGQVAVLSFNGNKMVNTGGGERPRAATPIVSHARTEHAGLPAGAVYEHETSASTIWMGTNGGGRGQLRTSPTASRPSGARWLRAPPGGPEGGVPADS
jgi:hypothetical protein